MNASDQSLDPSDPTWAIRPPSPPRDDATFATDHGCVSVAPALPVPEVMGDFRILRELGRGGMGVVYEATQTSLGRRVALKVLALNAIHDPTFRRRFDLEASAAARLHHTNIVPIFFVGEHEGVPYYAMQLIVGQGLDRVLRLPESESPLPPRRSAGGWRAVARLGCQAAEALAHAHAHGVVHRDVKPGNLLLDRDGELWVTDFGLAHLGQDEALTKTGHVVGTFRYMAPERFHGDCGPSGDIYALGATLYELATGEPAFGRSDGPQLVHEIMETAPPRPRRLNPALPRDLETIILKALARTPAQRYPSSAALADDLRACLDGKPIKARRQTPLEQAARWARRNPLVSSLAGLAFLLTVLVAIVGVVGYLQTREALKGQTDQRERAEQALQGQAWQRERAEKTLRLAMEGFDRVFDRLGSQESEGGAAPLSEENAALLQELLAFYARFAAENRDSPALRQGTARAHQRVGDIHLRLGQPDQAEPAFRSALALYEELGRDEPDDLWLERQAAVMADLALALLQLNRFPETRDPLLRAAAIYEHLRREHPDRDEYAHGLAQVWIRLADANRNPHGLHRAVDHLEDAQPLLERLVRDHPERGNYTAALGRCLRRKAQVLRMTGNPEAPEVLNESLRLLEGLIQRQPGVPDYRAELVEAYLTFSFGDPGMTREEVALRANLAQSQARRLEREHPGVGSYQALVARARIRQAEAHIEAQSFTEAEKGFREASAVLEPLVKRKPRAAGYVLPLADTRFGLARIHRERDQIDEALLAEQRGLDLLEEYVKTAPRTVQALRQLVEQYRHLSRWLWDAGETNAAEVARRRSHEWQRELGSPPPPPPRR